MNNPAGVAGMSRLHQALLGIGFCLIPLGALCVVTAPLQLVALLAIAIAR